MEIANLPLDIQQLIWEAFVSGLHERMGQTPTIPADDLWDSYQTWAQTADEQTTRHVFVVYLLSRMPGVSSKHHRAPNGRIQRKWHIVSRDPAPHPAHHGVERFLQQLLLLRSFPSAKHAAPPLLELGHVVIKRRTALFHERLGEVEPVEDNGPKVEAVADARPQPPAFEVAPKRAECVR